MHPPAYKTKSNLKSSVVKHDTANGLSEIACYRHSKFQKLICRLFKVYNYIMATTIPVILTETHLNILYKNYESKARFEAHLKSLNTTNM